MKSLKNYLQLLILSIICYIPIIINGQASSLTVVKGFVIDADTKKPIPFANIVFNNSTIGTAADYNGHFTLSANTSINKIKITSIGYKPLVVNIIPGKTNELIITLNVTYTVLSEFVVRPKKEKYKNKSNPAVEIINSVIINKDINNNKSYDYLEYKKYDKTQFALSNLSERFMNRKSLKKFAFIFDNIDTNILEEVKILPIYMKETLSNYYYNKNTQKTKEIIIANKMVSFEGYVDDQGMSEYLNFLYQNINIYDNTVTFATNIFLSPIASTAPAFYKYYIKDTTIVDGENCVELFFSPRNNTDLLFNGFIYITLDGNYAVKKIDMSVNKNINLNWVKDVSIIQEFENTQNYGRLIKSSDIIIDFGVSKNSMGFLGQRKVIYDNYLINKTIPDSVFEESKIIQLDDVNEKNNEFWESNRPLKLSKSEKGIYTITDSLKSIPAFRRSMNMFVLVLAGYKDLGQFEIGPVNTFYSYNPIEGNRFRVGGRTTPKFSKKISFNNYLAYGLLDKKFKYYFGTTYSLTKNTIYHFPVKYLKLSIQDETKIPGQELQFIQEDNILLSFKRGVNDKLLYNQTIKFEYLSEFENHFSYTFGYSYTKQKPSGSISYNIKGSDFINPLVEYINISEIYLNLRFAPQEKFYQGKQYRTPMTNKYPIFNLYYIVGLKTLGNTNNYQNLKINIYKRFYPGILGYTDLIFEVGKVFGEVSYPLLYIHRANQTYAYQLASYNLMNFLEFVSDEYVSLNIDHHFNGFIFNKIPFIEKLKLREVVSGKFLYGTLSRTNNPDFNANLFTFPVDYAGNPITFTLDKEPYLEISLGVENIFKFFRVDLVKRLTYLNNPNVSDIGIRVRFRFDF
jgi:hypothetical protein